MKAKYFGIIPATVRYSKALSGDAKVLFTEIDALADEHGYCYAQNPHFAAKFEVSSKTITRWINELVEAKFVYREVIKDDKGTRRRLYPVYQNIYGGVGQICPTGGTDVSHRTIIYNKNKEKDKEEYPTNLFDQKYNPNIPGGFDMTDAKEKLDAYLSKKENCDYVRQMAMKKYSDEWLQNYVREFVINKFSTKYYTQIKAFPQLINHFVKWVKNHREKKPAKKAIDWADLQSKLSLFVETQKGKDVQSIANINMQKFWEPRIQRIKESKVLSKMKMLEPKELLAFAIKFASANFRAKAFDEILTEIENNNYLSNYKKLYDAVEKAYKQRNGI